ncbi:MAG: acetyl-CoA hydrolase [Gammaproteobacteria bacterium]|nr:acetyl-CoA hydrolase [Gammaproteobacteria bacterium]
MRGKATRQFTDLEETVGHILQTLGNDLVVGLPLGIGKPNPLVNALYRRACNDSSIRLKFFSALSLEIPQAASDLEERFLQPFVKRHFGADYPSLQYLVDLRQHRLPENVTVSEFYLQSGAWLDSPHMQRNYISSNYTHVARDMIDMGVNLVLQMIAAEGEGDDRRYSLSSNPDVTLDLVQQLKHLPQHSFLLVAQVNENLPFMTGDAEVERNLFDVIVDNREHDFRIFSLPRSSVSVTEYAIGTYASSLIRDGGTLQLGIGALGDAFVRALQLRQSDNASYRLLLDALCNSAEARQTLRRIGGDDILSEGIYGASEMFMDGFMHLYRSGILKRRAYDDLEVQAAATAGLSPAELQARFQDRAVRGALLHAAFFLGSQDFYDWLRKLTMAERDDFQMASVSHVNQLYGNQQQLEQCQRRDSRFVNTTMKMTLLGAAVSDALEDQRLVSGVGGQYNFVAMAHALNGGRSILMLRSARESRQGRESNIVWSYGHTTIPRHLRDVVITEYGIADIRGKSDEDVIKAMLAVADSRDQAKLLETAKAAGKLATNYAIPAYQRRNTPQRLREIFESTAAADHFVGYPFGSDFTLDELSVLAALNHLKRESASIAGKLRIAAATIRAKPSRLTIQPMLRRMNLASPSGLRQRLQRRMLAGALRSDR